MLILKGDIFLAHDPGKGHPESSARLSSIYDELARLTILPNNDKITYLTKPREAHREELLYAHIAPYVDKMLSYQGTNAWIDADTIVSPYTIEAALKAVGGSMDIVEKIVKGEDRQGFCLVRPPGHHAEPNRAMGFCIFNNIAVAAAYLNKVHNYRVAIVDYDVHHGNGTQRIFYNTDRVLYISTHEYPFYPGSGDVGEIGAGDGLYYNMNIPLPAGMGDSEFLYLFDNVIKPKIYSYKPDIILVSAGYDAYELDPLGDMRITVNGYGAIANRLTAWADELCGGKLAYFLEGGYNVQRLASCVIATILGSNGKSYNILEKPVSEKALKVAEEVKELFGL